MVASPVSSGVTLTARYVSWVDESAPSKYLFGKTGYAAVDGTAGKRKQAILWFSSPFGPEGGNVLRATLTVKTRAIAGTGTHTLTAGLAGKWSNHFGALTWATKPTVAGATVSVSKSGAQPLNTVWQFDMAKQLQSVADGQGMYGIVVSSTVAELVLLQGQMGGGLNPTLFVQWTQAPKPPTALAPSGGRSVGEVKPVLRWNFFDHAGSERLASIQVQMSRTGSFTTPDWDSGEVATSWCTMDLSGTTYPGFGAGVPIWWRVRNRDAAGLWSGWSTPAQYRYDALPVVTMINPTAATPYVVDPTPPIDWRLTSGTQATWRVELFEWNGKRWSMLDTSGLRSGTETRWTPARSLRRKDGRYQARVFVADARDREATPGVNEVASAVVDFLYKPDGDVTSAYTIAASDVDGSPTVQLTWTNPQQPDEWVIWRDGKLLARYPGSALVRGAAPNYGITDRWVPQGEHTWQVWGIAGGTSWPSSTVTRRVTQVGTWLVNEETQQAVCFVDDVEHDLTMPEDVTVHTPLGASHSVAITGGRRGYEGTLSGVLLTTSFTPKGHSARIWRDNLLDFKTDTGQEYLLLIEDLALPVQISNVTVAGVPGVPDAWEASLSWRQVDDFLFDAN